MKISNRASGVSPSLTLAITAKAARLKKEGVDVVSFGAGEPDFDTPEFIRDAAKEALDKGMTRYTDASGTPDLRKAIAVSLKKNQGLDYDFSQIIVSNGAKHSLSNAIEATVEAGEEVIIPAPYWLTYPELVKLSDGVVVVAETADAGYKLTPDILKKHITKKTRAVILNNPNNPSGVVYSKSEIYALAEELEKHPEIYIISDEIYDELCYGEKAVSIATYSESIKNRTIIVNGVSKSYAMTGWRIGYTASALPLAKAMGSIQSHATSNPNSMAQYAALAAYTDPRGNVFLAEMNKIFAARRDLMAGIVKDAGLKIIQPDGAFYVMINAGEFFGRQYNGRKITCAQDIAELLLDDVNVAVVPCESFGAADFIRLSYATSDAQIKKGLERMLAFFKKLT